MSAAVNAKAFAAAPAAADAARLVECLASLEEKPLGRRLAVLGLDPRLALSVAPARRQRDGIFRYARSTMAGTELPFLGAAEARGLFSDERKRRRDSLLEGFSLLILADEARAACLLSAVQTLVCCVTLDSSALPFIYPFCEAMREMKRHIPIELIVLGEARLEKAAEYFAAQKKELAALDDQVELNFCGSVHFEPEEKELADSLGLPFLELFPGRSTHGEAKALGRRLFKRDLTEEQLEPALFAERMLDCLEAAN